MQEAVDQYITDWIEYGDRMRKEQEENPSRFTIRMRPLKKERAATQQCSST